MNKTEALKRLDALESEAAALRSIIEAPESVEKKPLIWSDDDHYSTLVVSTRVQHQSVGDAYADALLTLLDLRRQPGSEAAVDGKRQWYITATGEAGNWTTQHKLQILCPMFDSEASAFAAKEAVGWERIKKTMDTLHGRIE
jgi:hypothetical protein